MWYDRFSAYNSISWWYKTKVRELAEDEDNVSTKYLKNKEKQPKTPIS